MYINKAIVFGNLTRDPELRSLPSGTQVCSFGLATNRVYNDRDGKRQEQTEYHNIVLFGKQAENTAKYLHKGSSAYIEGRLQTQSWEQDGQKKYRTEIVADTIQFGPKGGNGTGGASIADTGSNAGNSNDAPTMPDYPEEEINPEDIPF